MKQDWNVIGLLALAAVVLVGIDGSGAGFAGEGIDPTALIDRIVAVDAQQRTHLHDVVMDAEYVEGETDDAGEFREKVRFVKKVYVKYTGDTAWYHEEYREYYRDGRLQSDEERDKEAASRMEKKRKRHSKDVSYSMLNPFYPDRRGLYDIDYRGVSEEPVDGHVCYDFRVTAREKQDTLINGEYYFDAESFHLVRVDFSPAKLTKSALFRLNELSMSIQYGPTEDDFWLPRQFDVRGRGRAMFFIGVKFSGTEYYRNPVINGGVEDSLFEVHDGN